MKMQEVKSQVYYNSYQRVKHSEVYIFTSLPENHSSLWSSMVLELVSVGEYKTISHWSGHSHPFNILFAHSARL